MGWGAFLAGRFDPVLRSLLDAIWPPRCLACQGPAWDSPLPSVCARCLEGLPWIGSPCARCGREAGAAVLSSPCGICRDERLDVDGVVSPLRYRDGARDLVLSLKFARRTPAAIPLGRLLADALLRAGRPGDLVVPVPLSSTRLRRRGHNQAEEIARVVARRLGIERSPRALQRRRDTRPQSGLSRARRRRNPRGAFRARRDLVEGRCVILVDDVVTTGATASACARALRRAGALRIVLAAASRA